MNDALMSLMHVCYVCMYAHNMCAHCGGRYESVSFAITQAHTIHGFSGTFDCTLFDTVGISTAPVHVSGHPCRHTLSRTFAHTHTPHTDMHACMNHE
jgi:hypothetical protein